MTNIAIIGAGPYGLSIAAHLGGRGVPHRIFGHPMEMWREHMPASMLLKSEGFASSLSNPGKVYTIGDYCRARGIPYAEHGVPIALGTFIDYCLDFRHRFVPGLEETKVRVLQREGEGFRIELESGEALSARRVVVAVGLAYFPHVPEVLAELPEALLSHSSAHRTAERFRDRDVAIVGAGSSALDLAAEMHDAGARVHLVCRKPSVRIHDAPVTRARFSPQHVLNPMTTIGHGWKSFLCVNAPLAFRRMPQSFRFAKVRKIAGPSGGWFIRDRVVGKVEFNTGVSVRSARQSAGRVQLDLIDAAGDGRVLEVDHVVAATGYRVDLRRIAFLDDRLRAEIEMVEKTPVLSSRFESSAPGLYFVGTAAANTFGPLLRFACGADFTARRVSAHLARG